MARAGFWSVGGYLISFRRDGRWYADDEVIEHKKIALLFSRHIQADGEGGWVVDVGVDRHSVVVEDTPLVVTAVDGSPDEGFEATTNDGVREALDCNTLQVGAQRVLYCSVRRGDRGVLRARFLRPAYYSLARYVDVDNNRTVLRSREVCHDLGPAEDDVQDTTADVAADATEAPAPADGEP